MGQFPDEMKRLVEQFHTQIDQLRSNIYDEKKVRIDFIDPMMSALGWDMRNASGYAEQYREVVHEDRIKVAGQTKAPDYSFRVGGTRKFFLEAKKPSVNVKDDIAPAYQLRRYAWSAKLPVSLLTDFEEFAVYDTRKKPAQLDKARESRREYFKYTDYESRWDFLSGTFSKQAILRGDFDKYCESTKGRGVVAVDDAFLDEIEDWRTLLASNLALRNKPLDAAGVNFATQRILDRIIFLRIAEDRGTEDLGQLKALLNGDQTYARLRELFRRADERYNSGLFHFNTERDRDEAPDTLTPDLAVDDKTLKIVIKAMYYPQSPYEFSFMSADILGSVYERFLGKVITLTAGHQAKLEDKPEVRKAGGVYYTPVYIVDYIVRQTVGKLLEGKTPETARKLKILDPACGSGSFLIGAYQFLLDWYLKQYTHDDAAAAELVKAKNNPIRPALLRPTDIAPGETVKPGYALTIAQRKRILLDHLHGVDLDAAAVEVTKLNLLLKCLEGETAATLGFDGKLFRDRALPDLGQNILCGNSLIGTDLMLTDAWKAMSEDEKAKINPFDYASGFGKKSVGGFDAVIGNPPYGAFAGPSEAVYLREKFPTIANSLDTFLMFIENAASQLRKDGLLGFIIPSGWVSTPSSKPSRAFFLENFRPVSFVSLPFDVFEDAYVDCVVFTAERHDEKKIQPHDVTLIVFPHKHKIRTVAEFEERATRGNTAAWSTMRDLEFLVTMSVDAESAMRKITAQPKHLGDFIEIKRGIETYTLVDAVPDRHDLRPAFDGVLQRYTLQQGEPKYIYYTPQIEESKPWRFFSGPRILLRQVLSRKLRLQSTFADSDFLTNQSVQSIRAIGDATWQSLLAVLNSRLMSWFFVTFNAAARRDDFPKIIIKQTRELPVPDFAPHPKLDELVQSMLSLHSRLATEALPARREQIAREIEATDRRIDQLVYELYGLTDDEIAVVEATTS